MEKKTAHLLLNILFEAFPDAKVTMGWSSTKQNYIFTVTSGHTLLQFIPEFDGPFDAQKFIEECRNNMHYSVDPNYAEDKEEDRSGRI